MSGAMAPAGGVERDQGRNRGRDRGLDRRRRLRDGLATLLCGLATVLVLLALFSILATLVWNGIGGLSVATLTRVTAPGGENGGLLNPIVGSVIQVALATLLGAPIGIAAGIFLAEYGAGSPFATAVRFISDMLLSAPSILVGLFVYLLLVAPVRHFSGYAGIVALAILVIPIVVRTTEDMLRLVPLSMREAAAALGAPRWKVVLLVCVRAAAGGMATGVLLAVARIAGETAPLLFTSLGNLNWSTRLGAPMASLPVTIYQYAGSAFDDWVQLAWTAALLITAGVLLLNMGARFALRRRGER
ncbi:phosphate ABC transporter permease PstA [Rhizosaccharibacter radicis]|uniref:Phosphate transport system permease protein PstA n=1 Tax=Rhizosaccharibacter radicis TaxID=2782605 RepID=A0ABT1VXG1_9PROT|nr:phosphate ABC transporter permease PstA [Acetobacteraceae bacterium KSS12]